MPINRRTFLLTAASAAGAAVFAACGASPSPATATVAVAPTPASRPASTVQPMATAGSTAISATIAPSVAVSATAGTSATVAPASVGGKVAVVPVKVAFSYIPNVQFAPFYVADANARFSAEGVQPTYDYGTTTDFMTLVAKGERDFLNASGDEVVLARANGLPVVYVMAIYQQYPVSVFAPKGKGLTDPGALTKLRIGLPGFFGATYIGYKAILYANKIDEKAVNAQDIGFTQVTSVMAGKVDAAVGYANNEPVQLAAMGTPIDQLRVSDIYNLPSAGIVTNEKLLRDRPEVVRSFLRGLLAGMRDTHSDPKAAFATVLKIVPEAAKSADIQQQVLLATTQLAGEPAKYGAIDTTLWPRAVTFMKDTGLLKGDPKPEEMYSTKYLP